MSNAAAWLLEGASPGLGISPAKSFSSIFILSIRMVHQPAMTFSISGAEVYSYCLTGENHFTQGFFFSPFFLSASLVLETAACRRRPFQNHAEVLALTVA